MKYPWLVAFAIVCLAFISPATYAAYPIAQQQANEALATTNNAAMPGYGGNPHNEDQGIFGILALIFAVTGLFPLAIASGIIGTQNGRKFKGIAKAGLLFGILVGFAFVCYVFYTTVVL
ncbi:MAG: hypothetical protein IT256_05720 [Chitinophagaceae bacterium]|nr:hypothetical protein [Chitinophagaceae bacterium]